MDKLARKQEIVPMTAARADGELRPGSLVRYWSLKSTGYAQHLAVIAFHSTNREASRSSYTHHEIPTKVFSPLIQRVVASLGL
jgi:hypothetical protein